MQRGLFIALEGLDGSGSSSQCEYLREYLEIRGFKVVVTKEPTNNLIGGMIRGALRHNWELNNTGMQLLFCADRAYHLEKDIIPLLEQGITVICDRYLFSSLAFGSGDCGYDWLKMINEKFPLPDLAFVLKIDTDESIRRIAKGRSKFELFENEEKLKNVALIYEKIASEYPIVKLIDANMRDKGEILKDIVIQLENYIAKNEENKN